MFGAYETLSYISTVTNGYNADGMPLDFSGYKPTYQELPSYDHLINSGDNSYNLTGKGFDETLKNLPQVVLKYKNQVAKLAKHLYDADYKQAAFNTWHFYTKNCKYKMDAPGFEEMRSPARLWKDRFTGCDCDCLSISSASVLMMMGYHPYFQIVAFNNKPDYGHIYVILNDVIVDCVMKKFDQEPDNVTKKLDLMIQNVILNGPDSGIIETLQAEKSRLIQKIKSGDGSAIDAKELKKVKFLILCANHEAKEQIIELMHYVDDINADGKFIFKNPAINAIISGIDGLGNISDSLGEIPVDETDIGELEEVEAILGEIEEIEETSIDGLGKLKIFNKQKAVIRKATRVTRKVAKKAAPKKTVFKKIIKKLAPKNVIKTAKKVAKVAKKLSPAHIVAKAAKKKITAVKKKVATKKAARVTPIMTEEREPEESNYEETTSEESTYQEPNSEQNEETTSEESTYQEPTSEQNEETTSEESSYDEPTSEQNEETTSEQNEETTEPESEVELEGIDKTMVYSLKKEHARLTNKIKSFRHNPNNIKDLKKTRFLIMSSPDERPHLTELMGYVDDIDLNGNFIFKNRTINAILGKVDGLGNVSDALGEIEVDEHDLGEIESIEQIVDEIDQINAIAINGLGKIKIFSKANKEARKKKKADKKAAGKTLKQKIKKVGKKIVEKVKKVAKKIRKFNPAFAIPRAAFLALVNLNFGNLAYKLSLGYMSETDAKKEGADVTEWNKSVEARKKVEKLFENLGGSLTKLKQAVDKGKSRKEARAERKGVKGIDNLSALNEPFTIGGALTACAAFLAKVFGWFKKINFKKLGKKVIEKLRNSKTDAENETEMTSYKTAENPNTTGNSGTGKILIAAILLGAVAFIAFK